MVMKRNFELVNRSDRAVGRDRENPKREARSCGSRKNGKDDKVIE